VVVVVLGNEERSLLLLAIVRMISRGLTD